MHSHPKESLIEHLSLIKDPRVNRTKDHELIDILVLAICALLCRAETFNDMEDFGNAKHDWFKTFLSLPNGIPSHDTFNRVFQALDPKEFQQAFLNWTQSVRAAILGEIVAMDGKALRRALTDSKNPRYIVSAWAEDNGLVLGQLKVEEKTNEITAVPQLLRSLELSGCIVTLDAMGCQKNIAKEIKEADADYVLALKGNQGTVHQEIKAFLDETIAEANAERPAGVAPKASRWHVWCVKKSWRKITDAWRRGSISKVLSSVGLRIKISGKDCKAWAWSRPPARSRGKSAPRDATICRACPWISNDFPARCAVTGASRTSFIGLWMFVSAKTKAAHGRATRRKI
jgi:predicted transposase YbfD/YdcC